MRYINMTGGGGTHWSNFARLKPSKKGQTTLPRYGEESKLAHTGLREALASRQGFLCGFCMGHLNCWDKDGNLTWHKVKVAHLESQSPTDEQKDELSTEELIVEEERRRKLGINPQNMVLACKGETNGTLHCDTHQGNGHVTIAFNNKGLMSHITFPPGQSIEETTASQNNTIKINAGLLVKGPEYWQMQIGRLEVKNDSASLLNLNTPTLCRFRQQALDNFMLNLHKEGKWTVANYRSWIGLYSTPDHRGRLPAYCQVIIRALEKKIQQHN